MVSSDHEGFCLPVVEAMARDLPVVAFEEGVLGEVLGTAGVLLERKDPLTLSDAVHRVQTDTDLRARLVSAGRVRPAELGLAGAGERLADLLVSAQRGSPWPDTARVRPGTPAAAPAVGR